VGAAAWAVGHLFVTTQVQGSLKLRKDSETDENALFSQCPDARDGHGETEGLPAGTSSDRDQAKVSVLMSMTNFWLSHHGSCVYGLLIPCRTRYDEDITRLQRELEARGGPPLSAHLSGPPQHPGPSQPPPPSIGHGPSNLFGGIMANPGGQGGPGLATPQEQHQQPPPPHQMPQPPPGPQSQGPSQLQQPSFPGYPQPSAVNGQSIPSFILL